MDSLNIGPLTRRWQPYARLVGWMALLWVASLLIEGPYIYLRGLGDNFWTGHSIEWLERDLFLGYVPTRELQAHIYQNDVQTLDYFSFLMHGLWFGVTFAFGIVLMIYDRKKLLEYMTWQTVLFVVVVPFFMFLPVRPPWMEPGIDRVLLVRNYGHYVDLDNNPTAAFPSMHAAVPFLTALFFFLRCERRLWFYGVLVALFTACVSFAIVYMGEHWVVDVIGGYAAAGFAAWVCMSARVRRLYQKIPGDPVGRVAALNARICTVRVPTRVPEAEADDSVEPLPQAA